MRVILFILALLTAFAGATIFAAAKSAVHETEAFVLLGAAATLFAASAIVDALVGIRTSIKGSDAWLKEAGAEIRAQTALIKSIRQAIEAARQERLPPVPGSEEFFVAFDSRIEGPVNRQQLMELHARGTVGLDAFAIARGSTAWAPLDRIINPGN